MIEFHHVTKRYPGQIKSSLTDVSLSINDGDFCVLMGPSGAGKSTFLRLLYAAARPTFGTIMFMNQDLGSLTKTEIPFLRRKIGVVFQDFKLIDNKTALENVGLALRVQQKSATEIATKSHAILAEVGLSTKANMLCANLSGGEKQRVAIARAMVGKPRLLLCDEPTGNLDADRAKEIVELLIQANLKGATIILATHDPKLIGDHRKKNICLLEGKLVNATSL